MLLQAGLKPRMCLNSCLSYCADINIYSGPWVGFNNCSGSQVEFNTYSGPGVGSKTCQDLQLSHYSHPCLGVGLVPCPGPQTDLIHLQILVFYEGLGDSCYPGTSDGTKGGPEGGHVCARVGDRLGHICRPSTVG